MAMERYVGMTTWALCSDAAPVLRRSRLALAAGASAQIDFLPHRELIDLTCSPEAFKHAYRRVSELHPDRAAKATPARRR